MAHAPFSHAPRARTSLEAGTGQLYVRDLAACVTRPVRELKGFERVSLDPGESRTVTFTLTSEDLTYAGEDHAPTLEAGVFRVFVGADSTATLSAEFELN